MERSDFPGPREAALWIERHGKDGIGNFTLPGSGRRLTGMTTPAVEALCHPAISDWLKRSIITAAGRDPVDAARDTQMLAELMAERADRLLGLDPAKPAEG